MFRGANKVVLLLIVIVVVSISGTAAVWRVAGTGSEPNGRIVVV